MNALYPAAPVTLGLHPTARGLGWAAFNSPASAIAFGDTVELRHKNAACLKRVEALLGKHQPQTVVLETFEGDGSLRCPRIRELCQAIVRLVADHGHDLAIYTREEVRETFREDGAITRNEVAQAVARKVPALSRRLPPPRKAYESEDKRLSIFTAAALVITHFHNGGTALLNELRNAA
jgi:Holliday junction resolvasome RuvABC endonuclease subunit